ncbi:MAG: hypothetical protein QM786_15665 [Breznakibacter sp.]
MKRTQIGWVFLAVMPGLMALIWFINPDKASLWPMWAIGGLVLLLCYKLTVTIDDKYVRFSFGIGLIRGKYALDEVVNCRPVSYVALGWGIRYRPGAVLYNVSGNKAIELTLRGRYRKVWIGSDDPKVLADYINGKIAKPE